MCVAFCLFLLYHVESYMGLGHQVDIQFPLEDTHWFETWQCQNEINIINLYRKTYPSIAFIHRTANRPKSEEVPAHWLGNMKYLWIASCRFDPPLHKTHDIISFQYNLCTFSPGYGKRARNNNEVSRCLAHIDLLLSAKLGHIPAPRSLVKRFVFIHCIRFPFQNDVQ